MASWSAACRPDGTTRYDEVLSEMAHTVGISKDGMSRQFVKASKKKFVELMERRFEDHAILAIYMDGIIVDGRHILARDRRRARPQKHLMGLVSGSSENAEAVKDLLNSLIERGLATDRKYLFAINGSRTLRSVIGAVLGERAHVQRCRTHKIRNVTERLPKPTRQQIIAPVMRAAYKLPVDEGIARLKTQAAWLKADHPDAAASLFEGLEETFTVSRLDPTPRLIRSLATTNLIENPNGAVRRVSAPVDHYRDADMAVRWAATGFLEAGKRFRKLGGADDLWVLAVALHRPTDKRVDHDLKFA